MKAANYIGSKQKAGLFNSRLFSIVRWLRYAESLCRFTLLSPLSAYRIALLGRQWEAVSRAAEKAIPAPEGYGESGG